MMKGKILIAGTLFMTDEHIKRIEQAGYSVERLNKTQASEDELIDALGGVQSDTFLAE